MQRIRQLLGLLSGLVVAAGLFSFWRVYVPALGWREGLERWFGEALTRPWIWAALIIALVAGFRARRVARSLAAGPFRSPDADPFHAVGNSSPGDSRPGVQGELGGIQANRRDQEVRRAQVAAFLKGKNPDVPAFVDSLLTLAAETGASDVHLQPQGETVGVTLRCRGERQEIARYDVDRHVNVVRRIKVLASMTSYVTDRPQDGGFSAQTPFGDLRLRVSVVPSSQGETVGLRLAGDASHLELGQLGLSPNHLEELHQWLREPQGLVLLTGPTGSGKTTTLYSALGHLQQSRGSSCRLVSIEDPVEVDLPFVHQMQVDRRRQVDFAAALRSLLRQDPDVLMVGEIRDIETAKVAIQAGLSGHLILSTLHADSAAGVFPRLIDLGAEPFLAASSTVGVVSQRLIPKLCESCRHPRSLSADQRRQVATLGGDPGADFFTAEGCSVCEGSGQGGRRAVFELLRMTPELRRLVTAQAPTHALAEAAREAGVRTLADAVLGAALDGGISLDKALQWIGGGR